MSSRQSIARAQGIATSKNASRSRDQASNLINDTRIARNIQQGTVYLPDATEPVIEEDEYFLIVSPKFPHYYYIVRYTDRWITSSRDERFIPTLIKQVEQYQAQQQQAA